MHATATPFNSSLAASSLQPLSLRRLYAAISALSFSSSAASLQHHQHHLPSIHFEGQQRSSGGPHQGGPPQMGPHPGGPPQRGPHPGVPPVRDPNHGGPQKRVLHQRSPYRGGPHQRGPPQRGPQTVGVWGGLNEFASWCLLEQRRCMQEHPHIRDAVLLPPESERNWRPLPLQGAPKFTPRLNNLQQNFFELDPDNPSKLLQYFAGLLKEGNLEPSNAQKKLINELQGLLDAIEAEEITKPNAFNSNDAPYTSNSPQQGSGSLSSLWSRLFSRAKPAETTTPTGAAYTPEAPPPKIKGLYIWGGVGQGKTMILDAFFNCLSIKDKQRSHFHQFMLEVHQELHRVKQQQPPVGDPLMEVARKIRSTAKVLCFDEFQVVHITDAMIMKRLFEGLFSLGVVVVATSNRPPDDLYLGGLNRERFISFIPLLKTFCNIHHIETQKDYRLAKGAKSSGSLFFVPSRAKEIIFKQIEEAAGGSLESGSIPLAANRTLRVPGMRKGYAVFTFDDLCGDNVGAVDYLYISSVLHSLSIRNIPDLHRMEEHPNEIRRFISLIDVLYERNVRVIFDAEAPLFRLLGIPSAVQLVENMRKKIQQKFCSLKEALEQLKPYCTEEGVFSRSGWVAGTASVLGLSPEDADELYNLITSKGTSPLNAARLRSLLFFHMSAFDFSPPTTADVFLFSSEAEGKEVLNNPAVYELNNEHHESSGAQDNQFAFIRTISRIRDMTSLPYLLQHQKLHKLNDLAVFTADAKRGN